MEKTQKKHDIFKDTSDKISVKILPQDNISLQDIIDGNAPKAVAIKQFPIIDSKKKDERLIYINAERYSESHSVEKKFLQDLNEKLSFSSNKKYVKKHSTQASKFTFVKVLLSIVCSLILMGVSIGAGMLVFFFTKSVSLFYGSAIAVFAIFCLSIFLFFKVRKHKINIKQAIIKKLTKNTRLKNILIISNMHRIPPVCRRKIFSFINSFFAFNPVYYVIIANSDVMKNFSEYYDLENSQYFISDTKTAQAKKIKDTPILKEIENQVLHQENENQAPKQTLENQKPRQEETSKTIVPTLESPVEKSLIDTLQDMTAKALVTAVQENSLKDVDNEYVVKTALSKFSKLNEKVFNEYMSILSHKIKKMSIIDLDISDFDARFMQRFVSYFKNYDDIEFIMPLKDKALKELNSDTLLAFLPCLDNSKTQELREYVMANYFKNYNQNFIALLKPLSNENEDLCNFFMSNPDENEEKLYQALIELSEKMPESNLQKIYSMILEKLERNDSGNSLKIVLNLIAAYKDRFRFLGLLTTNFNEIIFNKKYGSEQEKIEYIQDLLLSNNVADEEKTRYADYLSHSCDDLSKESKMQVFTTLLKSGLSISKDTILSVIRDYENNKTKEYLASMSELVCGYYNQKSKDDSIFFNIACQPMDIETRSEILTACLESVQNSLQKVQKMLLQKLTDADEELFEIEFDKVILKSLGKFCENGKFAKNELIENFGHLLENQKSVQRFISLLEMFIVNYKNMTLNGDQKHDFKSAMFKGASNFNIDLSVITSCILKIFKIEYISFVEQKIAKQGDIEVEEKVNLYLENLFAIKE